MAFVEGFAQYLFILAFSQHWEPRAWFKYDKKIASGDSHGPVYADLRDDNRRVNVKNGSIGNWGGRASWAKHMYPPEHWGMNTEMDWQRGLFRNSLRTGSCQR